VIDEAFCRLEPLLGTKVACAAVGRARATHYRHLKPGRTTAKPRPAPPNKLTDTEVDDILAVLRSPRFVDCSPAQVYFTLLDEGTYLASESSFYRILRSHDEVRERRRQATHPAKVKPELIADRPLVVWSWDITKLKGPKRGVYYDLYVVLDIFSRYVVAWCVAPSECGELAKELIADAVARHNIGPGQLTIHADRAVVDDVEPGDGAAHLPGHRPQPQPPARRTTTPTARHSSRPSSTARRSPNASAASRTPGPSASFFSYYNHEHRHSGIGYHTPASVHYGTATEVRAQAGRDLGRRLRGEPGPVPPPPAATAPATNGGVDQRTSSSRGDREACLIRTCLKSLDRFRLEVGYETVPPPGRRFG
jgi:putative transposase